MAIFDHRTLDRIGRVIRGYLEEDYSTSFKDPDISEAEAELEEFLNSKAQHRTEQFYNSADQSDTPSCPPDLLKDFAELGLLPDASAEECKAAYRYLLKVHHPDRHAGHAENMQKATEKSARINAAYDRIKKWHQAGTIN
ncbi:MAG: DnaJ domain-containing protein [Treponema sp.]|nr:DnaJ domain-containing protein [Treponema sp.]